MRTISILFVLVLATFSISTAVAQEPASDHIQTDNGTLMIHPIQHGTVAFTWNNSTVYVDPTGGAEAFEGINPPDLILITHAHGDHMNIETLQALDTDGAAMVVPQSVADELPGTFSEQLIILDNGETTDQQGTSVRAVPMYNLPDDSDSRHPKGWGNGYILTFGGKNVYISGDTEGIPEMRSLKNIHVAFVCMNLPYTMDINQASDAVLDFEPEIVYPYHHRGQDIGEFQKLVTQENDQIEVRIRDWYRDQ